MSTRTQPRSIKVNIAINQEVINNHLFSFKPNANVIYSAILEHSNEGYVDRDFVTMYTEALNNGKAVLYYTYELFEAWNIIDRRILIEKTGCFL